MVIKNSRFVRRLVLLIPTLLLKSVEFFSLP